MAPAYAGEVIGTDLHILFTGNDNGIPIDGNRYILACDRINARRTGTPVTGIHYLTRACVGYHGHKLDILKIED